VYDPSTGAYISPVHTLNADNRGPLILRRDLPMSRKNRETISSQSKSSAISSTVLTHRKRRVFRGVSTTQSFSLRFHGTLKIKYVIPGGGYRILQVAASNPSERSTGGPAPKSPRVVGFRRGLCPNFFGIFYIKMVFLCIFGDIY